MILSAEIKNVRITAFALCDVNQISIKTNDKLKYHGK